MDRIFASDPWHPDEVMDDALPDVLPDAAADEDDLGMDPDDNVDWFNALSLPELTSPATESDADSEAGDVGPG